MRIFPDYEGFVKSLNKNKVKFIIVGAYALAFHGIIRATKDFDIWIDNSKKNAKYFLCALKDFFGTDFSIKIEDVISGKNIFQFGYAPVRIDIMTSLLGLNFSSAWRNRIKSTYGNQKANYLSKKDLIKSKLSAGRKQDIIDAEKLKRLH